MGFHEVQLGFPTNIIEKNSRGFFRSVSCILDRTGSYALRRVRICIIGMTKRFIHI